MNISRLFPGVRVCSSNLKACVCIKYSTDTKEIKIPKRIQRNSTDILQALASTLDRDYTAAHYKYHDDPYLIPMSNIGKRTFSMAKEAGKKAAKWVRAENSELFQHRVADPVVEHFLPKMVFNEKSEVGEETLQTLINAGEVSDAVIVYELLEKKGQNISPELRQSFLELLCFYNSSNPLPEDLIEERWFRQGMRGIARMRKTWKDGGMAETVFKSFESPGSAAYCALLQGMIRYFQVDKAWKLYQEMQEKQIPLSLEVYNGLISVSSYLRESSDLRWKLVEELLTSMKSQGLTPNINTMNAILEVLSGMNTHKIARNYALSTLSEFSYLGIKPSLGTYYYLLIIFCKERGPVSGILVDIMNEISGQEFTIQHPKDTFFFVTAMDVCRNHLQDIELAYRVDNLLHHGNNYDLIGDSYKESIYYRHFFCLSAVSNPLDVFMEMYNKLVPNIYIPEPSVMQEIIRAIELGGAVEHFPGIWADMVQFDHIERENLVAGILEAMVRNKPSSEKPISKKLGEVAWNIFTRWEEKMVLRKNISWTGVMLGHVIELCILGDNYDNAWAVMKKLDSDQSKIVGVPNVESLMVLLDASIAKGKVDHAIICLQYCTDGGYAETSDMLVKLKNCQLTESQRVKIESMQPQKKIEEETLPL